MCLDAYSLKRIYLAGLTTNIWSYFVEELRRQNKPIA